MPKVASSVGRGRPVAPRGRGSILMWSEFPVHGVKKSPRCARRKTWPSRAWARVRGFFRGRKKP